MASGLVIRETTSLKVNSYYPLLGSLYKTEIITVKDIFYCPSRDPENYNFTTDSIVRSTHDLTILDTDIEWVKQTLPIMIKELPFLLNSMVMKQL